MKKQYIYSALILAAALFAGCAKEIENTIDGSDSSAIELSSVSTDPMTKAVITGTEFTTTEAEKGIGLFLLDANGKAYGNNEANVKYDFNSGKWTASQPLRIGNTKGTLVGYYPYSESTTNVKAIPVASSINGTDWLYGSIAEITSAKAKTVSLTLSHALTRLRITFKRDASFVGSGTLSSLTIEGNGIAASGTLNATTGTISADNSAFTVSDLNANITTDGITEDCLVVPAASSATPQAVTLKFTVDGKAYKVDLKNELAVKLQSGIQTDNTLTVKNTSVSIDGSSIGAWGDGGSQTVTVGGNYTVTVKLHKGTPSNEVFVNASLDKSGNSVIIKASNEAARNLICLLDDGNSVEPVVNGQYFTFTISNVTKDITATICYEKYILKAFVYPSYSGTIISKYKTEYQPGDSLTLEVTSSGKLGNGGKFVGWKDKDGNLISEQTSVNFVIESDSFLIAVFDVNYGTDAPLGGVFTVSADKGDGKPKKVRFSKGNLYCSGASFDENGKCTSVSDDHWLLEQHQYDCGGNWEGSNRITHFMWSMDCMRSLDKTYDVTGTSGLDVFFTNSVNFAVNDVSAWHTLTTEEWGYLLGNSEERSGKYRTGVKVNGIMGLVIAPDNFNGTIESAYADLQWITAEKDDNLVFLPAAGYRYGYTGNSNVLDAGNFGYYWSASLSHSNFACDLGFDSGNVVPNSLDGRGRAQSVRLVTECK